MNNLMEPSYETRWTKKLTHYMTCLTRRIWTTNWQFIKGTVWWDWTGAQKNNLKKKFTKKDMETISSDLSSMNTLNVVNKAINSFIRQRTWALHVLKMSVRKNWIFLFSCDWLNLSSYWLAEIYNWRQQWAVIGWM